MMENDFDAPLWQRLTYSDSATTRFTTASAVQQINCLKSRIAALLWVPLAPRAYDNYWVNAITNIALYPENVHHFPWNAVFLAILSKLFAAYPSYRYDIFIR